MRRKIVAGNWKMNLTLKEAKELSESLAQNINSNTTATDVILCTPFVFLPQTMEIVKNTSIKVGAQNCSRFAQGAYTGEVSAKMLQSVGVNYVIIGHSERREYFNESSLQITGKIKQALAHEITPIFCCGEPLQERTSNTHIDFVTQQLNEVFSSLTPEEIAKLIIAYEPIWAIGTGETASPEQAQEMHATIRKILVNYLDEDAAQKISILYGGSVKGSNAKELFANQDIDGGLVGGASLDPEDFLKIIGSF